MMGLIAVRDNSELLKRLEAINRKPLENKPDQNVEIESIKRKVRKSRNAETAPDEQQSILYKRDLPRTARKPITRDASAGPGVVLEEAVTGIEILAPLGGSAFLIETRLVEHEGKLPKVSTAFEREFLNTESSLRQRMNCACEDRLGLEDIIFMDLETTGLSNSPVFLVGLLVWENGGLVVKQFFARNYSEEPAITSLFTQSMTDKKLLVTFNGRSFDFPYMRVRAAATGIPFIPEPPHLDMLHVCRGIYKGVYENCKLQTLEKHVCGTTRYGDIPGHEIPDAYHHYVRTSDAEKIVRILRHNALDLITLADLMTRLP